MTNEIKSKIRSVRLPGARKYTPVGTPDASCTPIFLLIPSDFTGRQSSVHSCSPSVDFQSSSPREKSLRMVSKAMSR